MNNLWWVLGLGGAGFLLWRKEQRDRILRAVVAAQEARQVVTTPAMVDMGPPPLATDETIAGKPAPFVPENVPDPDPRVTYITLADQAQKFQQSERFTARPTVIEEPVVGEFVTAKGRMLGDGLVVACSPMATKFAKMAQQAQRRGQSLTVGDTNAMRTILSLVKRADCVKANRAALVLAKRIQSRPGRGRAGVGGRLWTSSGGEEWHQVAGLGAAPFFQQYGDRRRGYAFTPGAEQYFSPTTQAGQNGFAGVFGAPVFSTPAIPMQKKLPVGVEHAGWLGPQFNRISAPPNWPGASV